MSNCVECKKTCDRAAVLCNACARANARGFRWACVVFALLGLFVLTLVLNRKDDGTLAIVLDASGSAKARECVDEGFAVNIWTDSVNSRVTCAAPY